MKSRLAQRFAALISVVLLIAFMVGCSGTSKPPATLSSIAVTPANPTISVTATQQFIATGTFSDNSTKDITTTVTWSSGTLATATISAGGLATPVAGGTSVITATLGTVSGTTTLTVTVPTLTSIAVTPANPTIGKGATEQFVATGTFSDKSTKVITTTVTWSSGTLATATISVGGLATALAAGTSTITATSGAISGNTLLTVSAPSLVSIRITPANPTIAVGGTADFTGIGVLSDGTTQAQAINITWSSGTAATASIGSTTGIALGLAAGTSTITATGGGVTGTTLLTVSAVTSRFAYVANGLDGSVSAYAVNSAVPTFTPLGYVPDNGPSGFPSQVLFEPSGRFAYVLNAFANTNPVIAIYNVNPVTGALTPVTTAGVTNPVLNQGQFPIQGVIDLTGRFLYVANLNPGTPTTYSITDYAINTVSGGLTAIDTPRTTNIDSPFVVIDHAGKFLYVIDQNNDLGGPFQVVEFSIGATGSLTPLPVPNATIATGNNPGIAVIDPTNSFLFVPNSVDDTVSVYSIAPSTGALTQVTTPPTNVQITNGTPVGPVAVAFDPSGKFLYVVNTLTDNLSVFSIGAGGVIGAAVTGSPFSTSPTVQPLPNGAGSFSINVDPAGTFVDVVNQTSGTIAVFKTNSDGSLTPTANVEARNSPTYASLYAAVASPTLAPAAVFATNSTAGTISAYTVTPSSGALVAATTATGVINNSFATTDITGEFFYATSSSPNDLLGLSVTQATAGLTGLTGSPFSLGGATSSVVAEPSDRAVYAALTGAAGSVLGFDTGSNTLTPFAGGPLAVANLNAITEDPQGLSLYALGAGFIEPISISAIDGTLSAGTSVAFAGTSYKFGGVDPSGQYLLAIDTTGNKLQSFSIGQIATALASTSSVSTGGTSPAGLAIDPLDRFVFVTDSVAKTVTTFTFSPLTGAITTPGTTTTLTGAATQLVVDATGTYLYVAVEGTPVTSPGSVAVFKISSTGTTLTPVAGSPFAAGVGTTGVAVSNSVQ
jgi:6-phosphogluconolactonase (cycloisomerase 2 family)